MDSSEDWCGEVEYGKESRCSLSIHQEEGKEAMPRLFSLEEDRVKKNRRQGPGQQSGLKWCTGESDPVSLPHCGVVYGDSQITRTFWRVCRAAWKGDG